jgi:hypothetical protein
MSIVDRIPFQPLVAMLIGVQAGFFTSVMLQKVINHYAVKECATNTSKKLYYGSSFIGPTKYCLPIKF